jgi:hypothetical protein
MDDETIIADALVLYKITLTDKIGDFKSGTNLDGILLPIRTPGTEDTWVNKWFIYNGEKLVTIMEVKDKCFDVFSPSRKKKKDKKD